MSLFSRHVRHSSGFHAGDDLQSNRPALRLDGVRTRALETGRSRLVIGGALFVLIYSVIAARMVFFALGDMSLEKLVQSAANGPDATVEQAQATAQSQIGSPSTGKTDGLDIHRADIVDRNGIVLSTSLPIVSLYAKPYEILDADEATKKLSSVLPDLNAADIRHRLASGKQFAYLRRNLTPRQQQDVNNLGIPGLYFEKGERRIYPHANVVAHVVGMTDIDNKGIAGIEKKFDGPLRTTREPVRLSLDLRLQTVVRNELQRAIEQFHALGALGMVVDVQTGEMLSMVSLPDFDPNDPPAGNSQSMFNRATKGAYEMGSTMKLFNTAMALDSGKANINSSYDCTRPLVFAGHTIHDDHPLHRWASVSEILVHSSNIGSARMAMDVGTDGQRNFMSRLGMLQAPSLELPEVGGPLVPNPWREINTMTISFGHGLSITPLQLTAGAAALVNGGIFRPLTLLAQDGQNPLPGERVLKPRTSENVRNLMRLVVTEGTGKKADVPGYEVGGKTGTAEKAAAGGYKKKAVLSSFVAAFPMSNPRYVVLASIDEPQGTKETMGFITAGWTAAPTAGKIISQIAPILGVLPNNAVAAPPPTPLLRTITPARGGKDASSLD